MGYIEWFQAVNRHSLGPGRKPGAALFTRKRLSLPGITRVIPGCQSLDASGLKCHLVSKLQVTDSQICWALPIAAKREPIP